MEKWENDIKKVKNASYKLLELDDNTRNNILKDIIKEIDANRESIIDANSVDIKNAKENNISESLIDRLTLNDKRIDGIIKGILELIKIDIKMEEKIEKWKAKDGFTINKVRVPFGSVLTIFEARPNVTFDIACMCIKTANACILRGGKEAINTNVQTVKVLKKVLEKYGIEDSLYLITDLDHKVVDELIRKKEDIDLVIPRGGKGLIDYVTSNSLIPVIETGAGNCHIYVAKSAKFDMALDIIENAKVQRPSVCNAVESVLVDEKIKDTFLIALKERLDKYNVEIRADKPSLSVINVKEATEDDYFKEYNDLIVSVKIVNGVKEAISHINKYSTHHSEAIITEDDGEKELFFKKVDSACVYHNASTRFTDGGMFGFGAEVGISTQKLHVRGPMGLKELTTYKYIIEGNGEVRS